MLTKESLVSYQGRIEHLLKILHGTTYAISDSLKWGILTNVLVSVYKTSGMMVNLSFDELPYRELVSKLQELSRQEVGDPLIPLEDKRKSGLSSAALSTMEIIQAATSS